MASKHSNTDTSMPDYASSSSGPNFLSEQVHLGSGGMLDDFGAQSLKVPTNTPTAAAENNNGQFLGESLPLATYHYD